MSALMCVGLLAGCGSGEESSGDGGSSGKLVYIAQDMNDSFASWLANSVESLGTERGYDVTVMDCQADGAKCVEMLENARNMSPDAIILQPMADAQVLNTIEGIRDDGIELVVVNLPLPEDPDAVPTVVCDDYTLGYEIA